MIILHVQLVSQIISSLDSQIKRLSLFTSKPNTYSECSLNIICFAITIDDCVRLHFFQIVLLSLELEAFLKINRLCYNANLAILQGLAQGSVTNLLAIPESYAMCNNFQNETFRKSYNKQQSDSSPTVRTYHCIRWPSYLSRQSF